MNVKFSHGSNVSGTVCIMPKRYHTISTERVHLCHMAISPYEWQPCIRSFSIETCHFANEYGHGMFLHPFLFSNTFSISDLFNQII